MKSGKFFAGVFVALLIFKPSFGGALIQGIGTVVTAAFERDPYVADKHKHEDTDERDSVFYDLFNRINNRIEKIEANLQPKAPVVDLQEKKDTQPVEEIIQPSSAVTAPVVTPQSMTTRELAHKRALEDQELLENRANYHGNDPVVRKRLDLPPKVAPLPERNPKDDLSAVDFDREFNKRFPRQ